MKKIVAMVMLLAFAASVCFAADAAKSEAKDPITGTCEVVSEVATAPVQAVFGPKEKTTDVKEPAKPAAPAAKKK